MTQFSITLLALMFAVGSAEAQSYSPEELARRAIERRAVEAVIWGMPAVNTELMYDQMVKRAASQGRSSIGASPLDWHNQTLTPNPDTLYFMGFYDTKASGAMVVEIPPAGDDGSLNGNFVTLWQTALEDAGLLGVDKGKGVKFVITPPGYTGRIPDGFEQLASDSYGGYFLIRSNLKSHVDADVQKSIAYGKRVKFYPLSEIDKKPGTVFIDVKDKDFNSTIKYDASFFALLDHVVQTEPWIARDRAMIDKLRSLGIEKGEPFAPMARRRNLLKPASRMRRRGLPGDTTLASRPSSNARTGRCRRPPRPSRGKRLTTPTPTICRRRPRRRLQLRLYRHQAPRHRPILPYQHQGQGRRGLRRRQNLSAARAAEPAG